MKIALTGASGFIGQHLARRLLCDGHDVRALLRRPLADLEEAGVSVVYGSIEDGQSLASLVSGCEAVVHAAGLTHACSAAEYDRVNAEATKRLADICAGEAEPPLFVLLSSLAAREPALSDYAASKQRAEEALSAQAGLDWVILRPPAVYGPGDAATLLLFRYMKQGWLPVPPDRGARVSLIYVDDLCGAIASVLSASDKRGTIAEVYDGWAQGYDWRDIANVAGQYLNRHVRTVALPKPLLLMAGYMGQLKCRFGGDAPHVTVGKVRELCHTNWVCRENPLAGGTWSPKVGIDEGFRRTLDWYRQHDWL